jgi:signal transduction histidine kinase
MSFLPPKILIVDDREENLFALQKILKAVNAEIVIATSSNESLILVSKNEFALIFLDVQMLQREGFEGATLMQKNSSTKNTPVIFVTTLNKESNYIFEGYGTGTVDYLSKPIQAFILINKVNLILELNRKNLELQKEVSRRKTVEIDLEKAKKETELANDAKSVFLANMNHEFRTPMNAILGYAQILMRDKKLSNEQNKAVETISKNGNKLMELIKNIIDISKIETGQMELNSIDFDMKVLIDGLRGMFKKICEKKNLILDVESLEESIPVHGDEGKIRQILVNLIENAVKFTETGKIHFKMDRVEDDQYQFEISDTGKGISEDGQVKIFQAFYQGTESNKGGTGLGLTISKKQAHLMKGELNVQSNVENGTTFSLILPLSIAKNEIKSRTSRHLEVIRLKAEYKVKALVVDDDEECRILLSRFLADIGIEVIEACNGKRAVESFRKNRPDIVYMNIQMPIMDGVSAIHQLKNEFPENKLNIVVVSASISKQEREQYIKLGCTEILKKPFRMEKVYSSVKNLLNIEFEYEIREKENESISNTNQIDYSKIDFPRDIVVELDQAVQCNNITKIDNLINNLNFKNEDEGKFLKNFINYKVNYDSYGMLKVLGGLDLNRKVIN